MVHSSKLIIVVNGNHQNDVGFALGETICFGSLELNIDRFGSLSLSHEGNDSGIIFMGMVHSRSLSLHTILKESLDEGDTTSSGWGGSDFTIYRGCNVVTPTVPITTTPASEGTPATLTISTVPLWTTVPQLDPGLPPKELQAYQEEQEV
jgi:hypothetical protein